jgi:hypothetical protein
LSCFNKNNSNQFEPLFKTAQIGWSRFGKNGSNLVKTVQTDLSRFGPKQL